VIAGPSGVTSEMESNTTRLSRSKREGGKRRARGGLQIGMVEARGNYGGRSVVALGEFGGEVGQDLVFEGWSIWFGFRRSGVRKEGGEKRGKRG